MVLSIGLSTNPCECSGDGDDGDYGGDCGENDDSYDDDDDDHEDDIFSPDVPSEKRVRRWAVSLENIIMDPLGVEVI